VRFVFVIFTMVLISGCSDSEPQPVRGDLNARSYPLYSIDMDPQRRMPFDPDKPYRLKFGRGSHKDGLQTIEIDEQGQAVLYRSAEAADGDGHRSAWETATVSIDAEAVKRMAELIRDQGLLEMNLAYRANVVDGSQWIFRLDQGDKHKSIYFENFFPESIQDFAVALDHEMEAAGADRAEWSPVPEEQEREHEQDLWESGDL